MSEECMVLGEALVAKCGVCGTTEDLIGTRSVPNAPYECMYCEDCFGRGLIPYKVLVTFVWGLGSLSDLTDEQRQIVDNTLSKLNIETAILLEDVYAVDAEIEEKDRQFLAIEKLPTSIEEAYDDDDSDWYLE